MKTVWDKYNEQEVKETMSFCEDYKNFLDVSKTEREAVKETIRLAKEHGYKDIKEINSINFGDKIYFNNKNKSIALFVVGKDTIENGLNILGAHIDSPRLDLKPNPLYENEGLALFDTHYYGGIKKYLWVTRPLAIHGVVCKKDGTTVNVCIGENQDEPVVEISDLLIHLSHELMQKSADKVVEGEDLNALIGSIGKKGEEKDAVKKNILSILKDKYNIEEDDFLSAELELVPADKARDLGLDRSMIMAYGHDDRICAYTSLKALLDAEPQDRTLACILTDKEEIGSVGATGAHSAFFENAVAELINFEGNYSDLKLRHALENSFMLSSDVTAALDPNYASATDSNNVGYFGSGISFMKYTGSRGKSGSNDARAEYIAKVRDIMDRNNIMFKFAELGKVDQGGGGTIAYILANKNMEVLDAGIAVQNMHAPYETASKGDIYEAYRAYKAFLQEIK